MQKSILKELKQRALESYKEYAGTIDSDDETEEPTRQAMIEKLEN